MKEPVITNSNKGRIVEVLRAIAELMIWGDQVSDRKNTREEGRRRKNKKKGEARTRHDEKGGWENRERPSTMLIFFLLFFFSSFCSPLPPSLSSFLLQHNPSFFDYFAEKNILSNFVRILSQKCDNRVKVQIIQTLSILVQNLSNEVSIFYLLSNNYIKSATNERTKHRRKKGRKRGRGHTQGIRASGGMHGRAKNRAQACSNRAENENLFFLIFFIFFVSAVLTHFSVFFVHCSSHQLSPVI